MSGNRWRVFRSMSGWWAIPLNSCEVMDECAEHFPTHAEAMSYAGRKARTITAETTAQAKRAYLANGEVR